MVKVLPVLLSPLFCMSDEVFEYENPTPTGESTKRMLATTQTTTKIMRLDCRYESLFVSQNLLMISIIQIPTAVISREIASRWQFQ